MASIASQEIIQINKIITEAKNHGSKKVVRSGVLREETIYNLRKDGYSVVIGRAVEGVFKLLGKKKTYPYYEISWK